MQFCQKCQLTKPLSAFFVSKANKSGYQSYCKVCKNEARSGTVARTAELSRRRCSKLNATVVFADVKAIKSIYNTAKKLEKLTGLKYHVDHIDPLQNDLVCGFHIETNLQVLPASVNLSKSNKFTPYRICDDIEYKLSDDGSHWVE